MVGTKNGELQDVFNHELCHCPTALFESVNALRPTTFPTVGATYNQVFEQYTTYVNRKNGRAIVVFDGYSETPSTVLI